MFLLALKAKFALAPIYFCHLNEQKSGTHIFFAHTKWENIALSIKLETNSVTFSHVVKKRIFVSIFEKKVKKSLPSLF